MEYLDIMFNFVREAGILALSTQDKLVKKIKKDSSIVTNVDIMLSGLFRQKIEKFLALPNYQLLDEENLTSKDQLFNSNIEYLWTIDPIDGTTTYFSGFPTWAVAVSLYKNFKPYLGVIYLPAFGDLLYTDGEKSFYVKNAFTEHETRNVIYSKEHDLNNKSIIMAHKIGNYDPSKFVVLDFYSSYVSAFYTLINKSVGTFLSRAMSLWDITASLPILYNAGFVCRRISDNTAVRTLHDDIFNENWKLNDLFLICNDANFCEIKNILM